MSDKRRPPPKRLRAWLAAYDSLQPRARAQSLRGVGEAEDALHDAVLRASTKTLTVKNRTAYLARVAYNVAASAMRQKRRSIVSFDSEKMDDAVEFCPEMHTQDMGEELASAELLTALSALTKRIPQQKMRAFTLCRVYGYSYKETAKQLGISVDSVHNHVSEVLRRCTELKMELRRGGTDK